MEHFDSVRSMSSEIRAYAPDARVLTTYYCGIRHDLVFVWSIHSIANSDYNFLSDYTKFPARLIICAIHGWYESFH